MEQQRQKPPEYPTTFAKARQISGSKIRRRGVQESQYQNARGGDLHTSATTRPSNLTQPNRRQDARNLGLRASKSPPAENQPPRRRKSPGRMTSELDDNFPLEQSAAIAQYHQDQRRLRWESYKRKVNEADGAAVSPDQKDDENVDRTPGSSSPLFRSYWSNFEWQDH